MIDLSICIVSYNTKDLLVRCIESIYQSKPEVSYEIIVVDNNSTDGTVDVIKQKFNKVKLIENKENFGFAYANNQAIKRASGRYFFMLNSDTIVLPRSLDNLVSFMDLNPSCGAAGAKLLNRDMSVQPSCKKFLDLKTAFCIDTVLGKVMPFVENRYRMSDFEYNETIEVDQPMGAALIVRMDTIRQIGLLDERFFFFFEEVDWCYRIKKSGWKIFFVHSAEIMHYKDNNQINEQVNLSRLFLWHKSKYKFLRKYYPFILVFILRAFVIFSSVLLILKNLIFNKYRFINSYWILIKASL